MTEWLTLDDLIEKIEADLAWRGPTNRLAGHVVLTRAQAQAILDVLKKTARQWGTPFSPF